MNIILFFTIIVLFLIFTYQLILYSSYKTHEAFKAAILDDNNDAFKKMSKYYDIFPNNKTIVDDQLLEVITDKNHFNVQSDTNILININNLIKLNPVEFNNFKKRINIYKNLRDKRITKEEMERRKEYLKNELKINTYNYPIVREEISLLKMDRLISSIILVHRFSANKLKRGLKIDSINLEENDFYTISDNLIQKERKSVFKLKYQKLESYKFIKNWILEIISQEAEKDLFRIKLVENRRFKFKFDRVLNYFIDYENSLERFIFNGVLHRDNKEHNFFIYFDIIFDFKDINYYINDIIILGVNIEQYIMFADLLNKDYNYDSKGVHLSLSKENSAYVSDKYINTYREQVDDFLKDYENKKNKKNKYLNHEGYCFFKEARDKDTCISYTQEGGIGIWDTQCKYNEDCPFFKRNSNYPNNRGGCINGFCEMPVNVNLLGYKEYDEARLDKAVCHNCKYKPGCNGIECSQCCEEQKNSELYPELNSPDYAFPNDFNERMKHREHFEKKNMAANYLII